MKSHVYSLVLIFFSLVLSMTAQVSGSGTTNFIPKWTGSTSLGDSKLFQVSGKVGIGTTNPAATVDVIGQNATTAGAAAPMAFQVKGGTGGAGTSTLRGGSGGKIGLTAGTGGGFVLCGSTCRGATGGVGGSLILQPGAGGLYPCCGGRGGSIILQPGAGGVPGLQPGDVLLAPTAGKVGIGETNPANTLEIKVGGTTLADEWITRSSRRFKTNIEPLQGSLEKIEQLQGVSYQRKTDGKQEVGVVAEDVAQIVPEVVSRDPNTYEAEGVDYSRLAALLIEAVKSQQAQLRSQQAEMQHLKLRVEQLTSNAVRQ